MQVFHCRPRSAVGCEPADGRTSDDRRRPSAQAENHPRPPRLSTHPNSEPALAVTDVAGRNRSESRQPPGRRLVPGHLEVHCVLRGSECLGAGKCVPATCGLHRRDRPRAAYMHLLTRPDSIAALAQAYPAGRQSRPCCFRACLRLPLLALTQGLSCSC
jgi:hypothetical protein